MIEKVIKETFRIREERMFEKLETNEPIELPETKEEIQKALDT